MKDDEEIALLRHQGKTCGSHIFDYEVKTAHLEDITGEATVGWFEILSNMSLHASATQSCEEFENLWESDEVVDGIDLY